jgi:L-alanine-DL-glutamate epimerase-like enolase superfamily enzyme
MTTFALDSLDVRRVSVPYEVVRTIARGTETRVRAIEVTVRAAGLAGRGEAHAATRYGYDDAGVIAAIEAMRPTLLRSCSRMRLLELMPAGPARNAIDCALWDLESKLTDRSAEASVGLAPLRTVTTAYTISPMVPSAMAVVACAERHRPLLKVKLGHFDDDRARLEAVRRSAPDARLIADANEGWSLAQLEEMAPIARDLGVELIEQPLHANADDVLARYESPVPLCADESCHTRASLECLGELYRYINVKLDKAGGLTEALALARAARALGLGVMVGCMSGTTLSIIPGLLVAQLCDYVDLDSPMYLPPEEQPEVTYVGSRLDESVHRRWGLPT